MPSVTQVLADILPQWKASAWHLERGSIVHQCCALVAKGVQFEHDPQVDGQVRACRRFLSETGMEILDIEVQMFSQLHQYAGTADLVGIIDRKVVIADYKAHLNAVVPYQLAAYSLMYGDTPPNYGMGIELREDGTYKTTGLLDLRRTRNEWLSILTAYRVRQKVNKTTRETEGEQYEQR